MPMGGMNQNTATIGNAPHSRTEFVVLFIWREPTPSDELRGVSEGGDSGSSGSSAPAGGGMPGVPGIPGIPGKP